jgi:hypothetical protein
MENWATSCLRRGTGVLRERFHQRNLRYTLRTELISHEASSREILPGEFTAMKPGFSITEDSRELVMK